MRKIFSAHASKMFLSFPCQGCGANDVETPDSFCSDCMGKLPLISPPLCPGCGAELDGVLHVCGSCMKEPKRPWKQAVCLMRFDGVARTLIHKMKYKNKPELCRPLGALVANMTTLLDNQPDFIVPLPLHWWRKFTRGYNQAELLAEIISKECGIPIKRQILKRTKWTRQQAKLNRSQRQKNLKNAFSVIRQDICEKNSILLVDDVLTTGSTLAEAAEALRKAGAREINILVLARGY